ncbi:hypothetical protein DYB28_011270, partial [Aphanomyces astaci]
MAEAMVRVVMVIMVEMATDLVETEVGTVMTPTHILGLGLDLIIVDRLDDILWWPLLESNRSSSSASTSEGSNTTWRGTKSAYYMEFAQKSMGVKMAEITNN